MCGRVSVVDEDLLAPRHGLQRLDAEARQPEHRVLHPPETAVGLETVVGLHIFLLWYKYVSYNVVRHLVSEGGRVVLGVPVAGRDVYGVGVGGEGPVQVDHVVYHHVRNQ